MSLLDIAKLPTAENSAILLHASDNVAIARVPVSAGFTLRIAGRDVTARASIPAGHKVALRRIEAGENLIRYGQLMGRASHAIEPGDHVHTHNVAYQEINFEYEFPTAEIAIPATLSDTPHFEGYLRSDGRAGTRNYIAVVAASNCAAHTADLIAASFADEKFPP